MERTWVAVGMALAAALAGCSSRVPVSLARDSAVLDLRADSYRIVGTGTGRDCVGVYALGLVQLDAPSFAAAEQRALAESGGELLWGKRLYEGFEANVFVYARHCRYVEGTGLALEASR